MYNLNSDIFITVNICCYNSSKYLNETINSVLNQTYSNWELLIIDDGSTDNSIEIINRYKKNEKIKIIIQKRMGLDRETRNATTSYA